MTYLRGYIRHLQRRHLATSTIDRYSTDLTAFRRWLDGRPVTEVATDDIERFLDARKLGARARYRWLSELSGFYRWLVDEGHAANDPTARISRPHVGRTIPRPISDDDLARALDVAEPTMRAWLALAAYAGLRCIEIARLQGEDYHGGRLRVLGKGSKERIVPVHPFLADVLRRSPAQGRGPMWRRSNGQPVSASQVSHDVAGFLSAIGVNATAHSLRHWAGTNAYAATRDLRAVGDFLGHAHTDTTAGYTALVPGSVDEAVDGLPVLV